MWSYKILIISYIIVSFDEVQTHSGSIPWSSGTHDSTDAANNKSDNSKLFVPSDMKELRNFVRSKRDAEDQQNYTIELLVAVDESMIEYHGQNKVEEYVLTLMSSVSRVLLDESIGDPIDLAVVKISIIDLKAVFPCASDLLKAFRSYIQENEHSQFDASLLLTRRKLCPQSNIIIGTSYLGEMCSSEKSCTFTIDEGLSSYVTIAHELGHLLNAIHDEYDPYDSQHIMWHTAKAGHFSWSNRSRSLISQFLRGENAECLRNSASTNKLTTFVLNDTFLSIEKQCELAGAILNLTAENFSLKETRENINCTQLNCYDKDSVEHSLHYSWLNGTECGEEKWCQSGKCVEKTPQSYRLAIEWSECSQLCNGIQFESAYCLNEANQRVSDKLCSLYQPSNHKPCNRDCFIDWELKLSPCSAECGKVTQNGSYSCVQRFTQNHSNIVEDSNCLSIMPLPKTQECIGLCESAKWNYTEYGPCSCSVSTQLRSEFCISNDERIAREHCQHLNTEELERSCVEDSCWNSAVLTITCIALVVLIFVLFKLAAKVVAHLKPKDYETFFKLKYEKLDETLEFIDYNSFKLSHTNS